MAQQINLCTPILLTEKRYFSASTMAVSLGVFLLLGGALCAVWVWNLQQSSQGFNDTMAAQTREIDSLQAAIARGRANAAPVDPALQQNIKDLRAELATQQKLKAALQEGMLVPGFAHSDRMRWVAASIPDPIWVTRVTMDHGRFDVTGFTLEPSALNEWVSKLSAIPLMRNLKLSSVKVENSSQAGARLVLGGSAPAWSFNLISAEPPTPQSASSAPVVAGGQP